ncbi:hypothetical protein AC623_10545 [Bacillus sp. FJAT-27231]|uniref:precorrin-2 dehydrogenase/sirohydrochlorin ferrochelatase family protein n=1 Tax=Bacillus sp. FJAT-27231 TaxID=1679168 RepID=UPI000670BD72|nr:NAD(P)-dependent oxidoreductase [Bacillus sp. FJAT-27231]KMY54314.1 hypothetical protein AC623_10545 [Bacillus sp. FJAT-27231]
MLYPVMLNIAGKKAVVVGGGPVAARKARSLIEAGALVEVISPEIAEAMEELLNDHNIRWRKKEFTPADLTDAFIVMAATNSQETNELIQRSASSYQLVNRVDDSKESSFIVPASFKKDQLCVAVSTHGASPALSKRIIQELKEQFDDSYISYVTFLDECRAAVKRLCSDPSGRQMTLKKLASPAFEKKVKEASPAERKQLLTDIVRDWREKQ